MIQVCSNFHHFEELDEVLVGHFERLLELVHLPQHLQVGFL
jgi:hypothetical protein